MAETTSGPALRGPLTTVTTADRHAKNRERRVEYLELERQLSEGDDTLTPRARARVEQRMRALVSAAVSENMGLVDLVARKFLNSRTSSAEDFMAAGTAALWEAWMMWDPDRGTPFSQFAKPYIKGAVNREVNRQEKPHLPYSTWTNIPKVTAAQTKLAAQLGRAPKVEEIAAAASLTPSMVETAMAPRPTSLDAPLRGSDEPGASLYAVVASQEASTVVAFEDDDLLSRIATALEQRPLVAWLLRHGLAGSGARDLSEIQALTGVGRETCRRLVETADLTVADALAHRVPLTSPVVEDLAAIAEGYRRTARGFRPTLEQLVIIRDDICSLTTAEETAARLGFDLEDLLDLVARLGSWIAKGRKEKPNTTYVPTAKAVQTALHQPSPQEPHASSAPKAPRAEQDTLFDTGPAKTRRPAKVKPTPKASTPAPKEVQIPFGYGVNIHRSVGFVVVFFPTRDTLSRFLAREYPQGSTLTGDLVMLVWRLVRLGRFGDLERVNDNAAWLRLVAEAYETLDVGLTRAREGVVTLLSNEVDLDEVESAATKAAWLAEREFSRLRGAIALVHEDPSARPALERARRELCRYLSTHDDLVPAGVRDLREGQARRVAEAAGLTVDVTDERLRAQVRERLHTLGLGADADLLVPRAIDFAARGELDAFFAVMEDRAGGDPAWESRLAVLA